MATVKYDNQELVNSTYGLGKVVHEQSPERQIDMANLGTQAGMAIVGSKYREKYITVQGSVKGTSQSNLEGKIDDLKELLGREDKNLDVGWEGGTRRYVARCVRHDFDRDYYNVNFVPWEAEFVVPAGMGKDTTATTAATATNMTATQTTMSTTLGGSAEPKPYLDFTLDTVGNCAVVKVEGPGGDYIKIGKEFDSVKAYQINWEDGKVYEDSSEIDFRGNFPDLDIGSNDVVISILGSGSSLDLQQPNDSALSALLYDDGSYFPLAAQSFIMPESGWIDKLSLLVGKDGSPGGEMRFYIYDDDNDKPGSTVNSSAYDISAASITSSNEWNDTTLDDGGNGRPYLEGGKKYWIVLDSGGMTGTGSSNFFRWWINDATSDPDDAYSDGKAMAAKGTGEDWEDGYANAQLTDNVQNGDWYDMAFKIYYGDGNAASHQIDFTFEEVKRWL